MTHHMNIVLLLFCLLSFHPSVREAQRTVAVADSLRVNEGRQYEDSLALADAYSTMGRWRLMYADDYARACYYYGRLLRSRGNQVTAMQRSSAARMPRTCSASSRCRGSATTISSDGYLPT